LAFGRLRLEPKEGQLGGLRLGQQCHTDPREGTGAYAHGSAWLPPVRRREATSLASRGARSRVGRPQPGAPAIPRPVAHSSRCGGGCCWLTYSVGCIGTVQSAADREGARAQAEVGAW